MGDVTTTGRTGNHYANGMGEIDPEAPIDVDLYVCETCRQNGRKMVGKLPQGRGTKYNAACTGPADAPHKQTFMKPKPFREVVE